MSQQDDFFQVNSEVPFQTITHVKIDSVTVKEEEICVRASMALVRGAETQFVDLVRTDRDIDWLLENLTNTGQCPLLPKADSEGMFSHWVGLIGGTQPIRAKKLRLLKEKVLTRCLTLISTLLLEHLRTVDEHFQLPIFIFFHQNFALYHNPIYFKESKVSLKKKVGNYFWQKYALLTGKGNVWQQLESAKKHLIDQRQRLGEVTTKLQEYLAQLNKLQDEFISEKEKIKKRAAIAEQLEISFQMQLKYLDMVIEEAKQTAARAEQQNLQSEKLIANYTQILQQEGQEAVKTNQKLLAEYVKVICENEDKLRIAPY